MHLHLILELCPLDQIDETILTLIVYGALVSTKQFVATVRTCILEIHIIAFEGVFQAVRHDLQQHDLLTYSPVRLSDVDLHLWVINLIGQPITHDLWEVTAEKKKSISTTISVTHILFLLLGFFFSQFIDLN